ncbi:hypothetical protein [Streptomyces sp. NPDC002467]|uniref:hypothetical protein n=1 Tax=Streptomyces sp. NPDC002467 TaxID=3364647 RepID=UPI0036C7213D
MIWRFKTESRSAGQSAAPAPGPTRSCTRYDKTPDSYLAGLHLRASMIWIKDLARAAH